MEKYSEKEMIHFAQFVIEVLGLFKGDTLENMNSIELKRLIDMEFDKWLVIKNILGIRL